MKNIIIIIALLLNIVNTGFACDNCNIFMNISPNDYRSSFGVFYHTRLLHGRYNELGQIVLKHGGAEDISLLNRELDDLYSSYELRGRYYIKERWKTTFSLPIIDNTHKIDGTAKYRIRGIGDFIVLQSYQLYNTERCDTDTADIWVHRVSIGGGVKVPTGSIDKVYPYGTPNIDLQPGTGSWDILTMLTYSVRYKGVGFSTNVNVKYNGTNKNGFRYGNTVNANANIFYFKNTKAGTLMPFTGIYVEKFNKDFEQGIIEDSGGTIFFANAGIKWYKGNFVFNVQYQKVFHSDLAGTTQLFTLYRSTVGVSYNF